MSCGRSNRNARQTEGLNFLKRKLEGISKRTYGTKLCSPSASVERGPEVDCGLQDDEGGVIISTVEMQFLLEAEDGGDNA